MSKKKLCVGVMLSLLIMCSPVLSGLATVSTLYSYGMQLLMPDGSFLPKAPLSASFFDQQLLLRVYNDMENNDRFMLLFFLDDKLLPCDIDGKMDKDFTFYIEAKNYRDILFNAKIPDENENKYCILHIIIVGLLDETSNNSSGADLFSTYISIPLNSHFPYKKMPYSYENRILNPEYNEKESFDIVAYFPFSVDKPYYETGRYQYTASKGHAYPLAIACEGKNNPMCFALFVDNVLVPIDNRDTLMLVPESGYTYLYTVDLQLDTGVHQAYLLYMSMNDPGIGASNSRKIFIHKVEN